MRNIYVKRVGRMAALFAATFAALQANSSRALVLNPAKLWAHGIAMVSCARRRNKVPRTKWWRRMRTCQRCPIYNRKARTCGTPGNFYLNKETYEVIPEGCRCWMPWKAQCKDAGCWAREEGLDFGWEE
jgi:hypothetical protein